jgi:hypothetical protein
VARSLICWSRAEPKRSSLKINQTCTKSELSVACDTILTTYSDNLYYIYHYYSRFLGLAQLGTTLIFFKEPSRAEPLAQTLEMIELSQAKGSKLRNYRAEPIKLETVGSSFTRARAA